MNSDTTPWLEMPKDPLVGETPMLVQLRQLASRKLKAEARSLAGCNGPPRALSGMCSATAPGYECQVSSVMIHLNDNHGWTREAIADLLEANGL